MLTSRAIISLVMVIVTATIGHGKHHIVKEKKQKKLEPQADYKESDNIVYAGQDRRPLMNQ